ncbi:hypothetical protein ACHAXR_011399, partial [Thalassiosira sp. AJA248-18]
MKVIGVYGVARESNTDAQKAINNKAKRIKIIKTINKCRSDFYRQCEENNKLPILILAGDLQDTITKTDFDNNGSTRLEQHPQGVLKWCLSEEVKMKSLGYEYIKKQEDSNGYITRQGYEGARGIDHIMGNDIAGNLVQGFEIDKHGVHIQVNRSDHHLLMMDLLVEFDWENSEVNETIKSKYGKIYGIPMKMVIQEDSKIPKYVHDTEKSGEELEKDEDHKTLARFRKAFDENKKVRDLEESIKNRGDSINKGIIELVKHEAREGNNRLPKRTEKMRRLIDKYFEELVEAMQVVMEDLNLNSRVTPDSAGHSKRNKRTKSSATLHQSMRRAKSGLNKLHNACTQAIEHTKRLKKCMEKGAIAPSGLIKEINNLIDWINTRGEKGVSKMVGVIGVIENQIENRQESEKEKEMQRGIGLDALDGSEINKSSIYKCALEQDNDIIDAIDKALSNMGSVHNIKETLTKEDRYYHKENDEITDLFGPQNDETSPPNKTIMEDVGRYWRKAAELTSEEEDGVDLKLERGTIENTIKTLEETRKNITRLVLRAKQSNYREWMGQIRADTLKRKLKTVTKQIMRPPFDAPEAHPEIYDGETPPRDDDQEIITRPAISDAEYLKATKQHHGLWTGTSGEERDIHWIEETVDEEGNKEFHIHPNELPPDDNTVRSLLREKGKWMSDENIERFKDAHNDTTANAFKTLPEVNANFLYPYTVDAEAEEVEFDKVAKMFWKAIEKIPGKARHKGFQMAVIRRAPIKWAEHWLRGMYFILAMRTAPKIVKELTRCPIPKGADKPGETRPLSLVHDAWAFINTVIYGDLARAVERSNILDNDTYAYRKGKSAIDAVIPITMMLEECYVCGEMVGLQDEDEEKYFDRILHPVQHATMKAAGMPDEGFIEIKMEDMLDRKCTVMTNRGEVEIMYLVGVPQGQKMSVIGCNLVTKEKTKQWILEDKNNPIPWSNGFRFACNDKLDMERGMIAIVLKKSYCDDATLCIHDGNKRTLEERIRYNFKDDIEDQMNRNEDFDEIIITGQSMVNRTGNFSLTFKLPRNAKKSMVAICNVDARIAHQVPDHFKAFEFSHKKAGPKTEKLPVRYSVRRLSVKADDDEKKAHERMIKTVKRILGVFFTLDGDTSPTGKKIISKINHKIKNFNIPQGIGPSGAATLLSVYLSPTGDWAPLLSKLETGALNACDRRISNNFKGFFGLASSDSKIHMFRPTNKNGLGVKSIMEMYIKRMARETVVVVNSHEEQGMAIRNSLVLSAQIAELKTPPKLGYTRSIEYVTDVLSRFGIFVRDMADTIESIFMEILIDHAREKMEEGEEEKYYLRPLGDMYFQGAGVKTGYLGTGDRILTAYKIYGKWHNQLRKSFKRAKSLPGGMTRLLEGKNWMYKWPGGLNHDEMAKILQDTLETIKDSVERITCYYEWRRVSDDKDPTESSKWQPVSHVFEPDLNSDKPMVQQIQETMMEWIYKSKLNHNRKEDKRKRLFDMIKESPYPPIIAMDGSSEGDKLKLWPEDNEDEGVWNAANATLFVCPRLEEGESWKEADWIPLISRTMQLPNRIGAEQTDNGHGEINGFILAEEMMPTGLGAAYLTDSNQAKQLFRNLRDGTLISHRRMIRSLVSGKGTSGRLLLNLALHSKISLSYMRNSAGHLHELGNPTTDFDWWDGWNDPSFVDTMEGERDGSVGGEQDIHEITNRHFQMQLEKVWSDIIHDDIMPSGHMGNINQVKQKEKMKAMSIDVKGMINNKKECKYVKESYDAHPHRPVWKVDSHQIGSNRYEKETPCHSFVQMNDIADRNMEIKHKITSGNYYYENVNCTPEQPFEACGLRFTLMVRGKAITKSDTRMISNMADQQRRYMSGARAYQGLIARHEDDIDITHAEIGARGGVARRTRNQSTNLVRANRMNKRNAYLHAIETEGREVDTNINENDMKSFMCKERQEGVFELCPHCGKEEICKFREHIEEFVDYINRTVESDDDSYDGYIPTKYQKHDQRRYSVMHGFICTKPEIAEIRKLGNDIVQRSLRRLLDYSETVRKVATKNKNTRVKLMEAIKERYAEKERECYLCAEEDHDKTGVYEMWRKRNFAIIDIEQWRKKCKTQASKNALEKWPDAIELGFFLPEGLNPCDIHRQCVLETMWMGWIPKDFKESTLRWLKILEPQLKRPASYSKIKKRIINMYNNLRYAVYQRADAVCKAVRCDVKNYHKMLRDKSKKEKEMEEEDEEESVGSLLGSDAGFDDLEIEEGYQTPQNIEEDDDNDNEEDNNNHAYDCQGKRCIIARQLGRNPKTITREGLLCKICRDDKKEMDQLARIESKMLSNMEGIIRFLEDPVDKKNKIYLLEWIKKNTNEKTKGSTHARLANTLLIKTKCATNSRGIDLQLNDSANNRIRNRSKSTCTCIEGSTTNEDIEQNITTLPFEVCVECRHMKCKYSLGAGSCRTCGIESFDTKIYDSGVCQKCQLAWLLTEHNSGKRREMSMNQIEIMKIRPEEAEAERMISNMGRITDPQLIPLGMSKNSTSPEELIRRIMAKEGESEIGGSIQELIGQFWSRGSNEKRQEHMEILQTNKSLTEKQMNKLLKQLHECCEDTQVVEHSFFTMLEKGHGWNHCRRLLTLTSEESKWTPLNMKSARIDAKTLILPIYNVNKQSWSAIIRFGDYKAKSIPWIFILMNPSGANNTITELRKTLQNKTTLQLKEGIDGGINNDERENKARWHEISCPETSDMASGLMIIIYIICAMGALQVNEIQERLNRLKCLNSIEQEAREWVRNITIDKGKINELPKWMMDVMRIKDQPRTKKRLKTKSRKRKRTRESENDHAENKSAKMDHALMSNLELNSFINKMWPGKNNDAILDSGIYEMIERGASSWKETRKQILPCENSNAWQRTNEEQQYNNVRIDAERLFMPVLIRKEEMNHYAGLFRFRADKTRTEKTAHWDMIIVDSMNDPSNAMRIKTTILENSTLANKREKLEENVPNADDQKANWNQLT